MAKTKTKEKTRERERADGPRARNDAYVMMLVITFVAILAGCILLYLDYAGTKDLGLGEDPGYGQRQPPKENIVPVPPLGGAAEKSGSGPGGG